MNEPRRRVPTRPYRVVRKVEESDVITSFYLAPADGEPLAPFLPGQFLTFQFPALAASGPLRRNYSLSGSPDWTDCYRISVKREPAPLARPDLSPGLISNHLHAHVAVGDELIARGPDGRFTLDTDSARPVILLSAGVGMTPLTAMAHALAREGRRRTRFIHACEHGGKHGLASEIRALASANPSVSAHFLSHEPNPRDLRVRDDDVPAVVTREWLQSLLPLDDYDVYLCGPASFMQHVYSLLVSLGLREERIRYEFFGPATRLRAEAVSLAPPTELGPAASEGADATSDTPMVTFSRTGVAHVWDPTFGSLLDFAEARGLAPDFSCRAGICRTCESTLESGEVEYVAEPLEEPEKGRVLLCCARPRSDVTIGI